MTHRVVDTDERTFGGWSSPTTTKQIPATIADTPAQRMRFLVFMCVSLMIVIRVAIRRVRQFGLNLNDRKQWQAEITHFPEHAMERCLIDHRATEERLAVVCSRDG